MATTRTLGPLHFEDLEPHRFEDLIRQLIYDFRRWRELEATGRSGSDSGFDVRAWEMSELEELPVALGDDEENSVEPSPSRDRLWLIQCKREKSIGPKKLATYLNGLPSGDPLHGVIFAAAADFSKQARDLFRERVRTAGISEAFLWGKAEIEDMLYQPKNDHLLFAYFGVSLQIRQRSIKTAVRAKLAVKRKAERDLTEHADVLVRDATDDRYPWLDDDKAANRFHRGRWKVYRYAGANFDGLRFDGPRHFAFLDDDGESWDFADVNSARVNRFADPWADTDEDHARQVEEMRKLWDSFPEQNRAWFSSTLVLPFQNVIDLDKAGDGFFHGPHVYTVAFSEAHGPFLDSYYTKLATASIDAARTARVDFGKRIQKFPRQRPKGK